MPLFRHRILTVNQGSAAKRWYPQAKLLLYLALPVCFSVDWRELRTTDKSYMLVTLYHTIPTFNDPIKNLLKTLMKKEKMLVTSIFSFFHNVFFTFLLQTSIFESQLFCCLQGLSIWISQTFSSLVKS